MSDAWGDDDVQVVTMAELPVLTEEQIKADVSDRRSFIGGSDAPVILGLVGWKTRFELYQEKRGEKEPDDLSEVERVQWGIILEDVVAQMYMKRTGKKVRRVNNRIIDKASSFPRAAQVDRRIVGGGLLEIKTTDASQAAEWGPEGSSEIPTGYYAQVQHQLAVTGENLAEVAVLIGGNRMRLYVVPRDQEFIDDMTAAEEAFWNCVVSGNPPEPLSLVEAGQRWARAAAAEVAGTIEDGMVAAELLAVKDQVKELEKRADALELKLKESIRDIGDTLMVNGVPVATWKVQVSKRLDTKALEEAHPDIAEAFRKPSESRVFRINAKGAAGFRVPT